ncbi:MAG: SDR family NAD(P)-dependent oxidoreductase, partial [Verrucomicrobiota bacterium]
MKQARSQKFSTKGCTALITGATAGLGAEFAKQLAPVAARLILVGRREERLGELSASLRQHHASLIVDPFVADLSLPGERSRLASWIIREQVPANLLINNAGLGDLG